MCCWGWRDFFGQHSEQYCWSSEQREGPPLTEIFLFFWWVKNLSNWLATGKPLRPPITLFLGVSRGQVEGFLGHGKRHFSSRLEQEARLLAEVWAWACQCQLPHAMGWYAFDLQVKWYFSNASCAWHMQGGQAGYIFSRPPGRAQVSRFGTLGQLK